MNKMRLLSIDYDYFQKVSVDIVREYPLGYDTPTDISLYVWNEQYQDYPELSSVKVMRDELETAKQILTRQNPNVPVMIANSHKDVYDFIHSRVKTDSPLEIVNVDMHHDMFNDHDATSDNPILDCGNWISFLLEEYKCHALWLPNPISRKIYGIDKESLGETILDKLPVSLKELENEQFDLVFLCRSDIWTPPHLDDGFSELCKVIKIHFKEIQIEDGIENPREPDIPKKNKAKAKNKMEIEQ